MDSSKFASPFLNKSPLYGAYYSGADGMVTVSYADIHKDFQKGLSDNVAKARAMHDKKNVNNCVGLDDKLLNNKMSSSVHTKAKKICAEREKQDYLKSPEGKKAMLDQKVRNIGEESSKLASETLQGYEGEFDLVKTFRLEKERKRKKEQDTISNAGKLIFK